MRVCAVCRVENPAYIGGADPAEPAAKPDHVGSSERPERQEGSQDQLAKVSVEANFDALQGEIRRFREDHPAGKIIGVFGSPDSGKSFLNARLDWLVAAKRRDTTGKHGFRVIRATQANTATWAEFDIEGPAGGQRRILVVDLPGEEFRRSTLDEPQENRQHNEVLQAADGLLIYISADVIHNPGRFQPNLYSSGTPPQQHYSRFLELAHEKRSNARNGLCDLPVFVALSRADRVFGSAAQGKVRDPWQYLCEKSPPLASRLAKGFTTFCCGFVASHVGAEARVSIGFSPKNSSQRLPEMQDTLVHALRGAPLEAYFRACLITSIACPGNDRLPTPQEMQQCSLTEQGFSADATLVAKGEATEYTDTLARVQHLVSIDTLPMADDHQPSFGVRSMMDRMIDLMDEPSNGIYRGVRFSYASLRATDAKLRASQIHKDAAGWVARRLPDSRSLADRLLRRLRLLTKERLSRVRRFGVVALMLAAIVGVYMLHAVPEVSERSEGLRQTVRGVAGLPADFALDAGAVWNLKNDRLEQIRLSFMRQLIGLDLHTDHLVQVPMFAVAQSVNEAGEDFHALLPASKSIAGDRTREFLASIDCSNLRHCELLTTQAGLFAAVPGRGTEGARVLYYAAALNAYLRDEPSESIQRHLDQFELARRTVWRGSVDTVDSPTKQILLPTLLRQLLLAHARFRGDVQDARNAGDTGRRAYRRYGETLVAALDSYLKQSADLYGKRAGRVETNLNQELRLIGIDPNMLAVHLLATAVAATNSYEELQAEAARLGLLAAHPGALEFDDMDRYAAKYPELLCLHHQLRQSADTASSIPAYAEACELTESKSNPFRFERQLVDPRFWAGDRSNSDIPFERWAAPIREAAQRAAKSEEDPNVLNALQSLSRLPTERSALSLMLEPASLWRCLIAVLLGVAAGWVLLSFSQLVLAAHRLVSPYTRDKQQI